jgi:hypothetical protein
MIVGGVLLEADITNDGLDGMRYAKILSMTQECDGVKKKAVKLGLTDAGGMLQMTDYGKVYSYTCWWQ